MSKDAQPVSKTKSSLIERKHLLWADDLEEGMLGLVSRADTGGLLLLSLQFDSQFALWLAIDCWTSSVTSLPYALDPDFVTPQIAIVLDHSLYSVP